MIFFSMPQSFINKENTLRMSQRTYTDSHVPLLSVRAVPEFTNAFFLLNFFDKWISQSIS